MYTEEEIKTIALDMATKVVNIQPYEVLNWAQQFENYLRVPQPAMNNAPQVLAAPGGVNLGGGVVSSGTLSGSTTTSSPTCTTITLSFSDQVLNDLDTDGFDLIQEICDHLDTFHRVVYRSTGRTNDIQISSGTVVGKRGSLCPQILTTVRP